MPVNLGGPEIVKALQRKLGVHVDGSVGSETIGALQRYLHSLHVDEDGVVGPKTTRALQTYLGVPSDGKLGQITLMALSDKLREEGHFNPASAGPLRGELPAKTFAQTPEPSILYSTDIPTVPNGAYAKSLMSKEALNKLADSTGGINGKIIREAAAFYGADAHTAEGRALLNAHGIATGDDAWCARFADHCLKVAGSDGTGSASALSFSNDPHFKKTNDCRPGMIAVFNRGNFGRGDGRHGHVTIFLGFDEQGNVIGFGGNQGGHFDAKVNIETFDRSALKGIYQPPTSANIAAHSPPRNSSISPA